VEKVLAWILADGRLQFLSFLNSLVQNLERTCLVQEEVVVKLVRYIAVIRLLSRRNQDKQSYFDQNEREKGEEARCMVVLAANDNICFTKTANS